MSARTVGFRLPAALVARIDRQAQAQIRNRTQQIIWLLERALADSESPREPAPAPERRAA